MSNPKCTLPKEERPEIFRQFRGTLDADEEEAARSMFPQYLFFRWEEEFDDTGLMSDRPKERICFCTACRRSFTAVRGGNARGRLHNEPCNCPECGARVTGKAVNKYRWDMPALTSWIKTAVAYPAADGGLIIEAGDCRRSFSHDDLAGALDWYPKARYYFRAGCAQMWKEIVEQWGWCAEERRVNWQLAKTVHDPFQPSMMGYGDYDGSYSVIFLGDALEKSELRYCQISRFYDEMAHADMEQGDAGRGIVKYLAWYAMHPQVEFAVKMGFTDAVYDLVTQGKKNAKFLNWNARTPENFLRMSRTEARVFLKAQMEFQDLKLWKELAPDSSFDVFMDLTEMVSGTTNLQQIGSCAAAARVDLAAACRYVKRMEAPCARYALPLSRIIRTWKDYLDMAERLDYDLKDRTVAMPKNLQERHDAAAEALGMMERLDEMKRYRILRKKLEKKYAFTMDGLRIVVPASGEEIVQEGKTLRHCVGGYAARHLAGRTTILFLRKARTPMRSFLTIELTERRGRIEIAQIHGYQNERWKSPEAPGPEERYAWFLNPWLEWVNAGSERDKNGAPVLPQAEKKEEVRTA